MKKKMSVACALRIAAVPSIKRAEARTRNAVVVRAPEDGPIVTAPVLRPTPWAYDVVPRYRCRPKDDEVDL